MKQAPAIYTSDIIKSILDRDAQERKNEGQPDFIKGECTCTNQEVIDEAVKNNYPIPMKNWAAKFYYLWGTFTVWTEGANFTYKSKRIVYNQPIGA